MAETLLRQLALVSESQQISFSELTRVSAALQKQATRDFSPIWSVEATVDAFERLEDVPLGYWPMIVMDNIGFDAAGIHLDKDGQPFALITAGEGWALTASHETLEMLADPFGNRVVAGDSPKPDQGRVEFLVEVCDPSEAEEFGYTVNGILVSDFYTPSYFDPVQASGVRYSFTSALTEPRQVLRGGYLSWHDPVSDDWWQEIFFSGPQSQFRNLGPLTSRTESIRAQIDRRTNQDSRTAMASSRASLRSSRMSVQLVARSTSSKASTWRSQIQELMAQTAPGAHRSSQDVAAAPPRRRRPVRRGAAPQSPPADADASANDPGAPDPHGAAPQSPPADADE